MSSDVAAIPQNASKRRCQFPETVDGWRDDEKGEQEKNDGGEQTRPPDRRPAIGHPQKQNERERDESDVEARHDCRFFGARRFILSLDRVYILCEVPPTRRDILSY